MNDVKNSAEWRRKKQIKKLQGKKFFHGEAKKTKKKSFYTNGSCNSVFRFLLLKGVPEFIDGFLKPRRTGKESTKNQFEIKK